MKITVKSQEMAVQKFERDLEQLVEKHARSSEGVMDREEVVEMLTDIGVFREIEQSAGGS